MQTIDTLLSARWIIPVEPEECVLEYHSLALQNGRIVACLPSSEAVSRYCATEHLELTQHALLPGLINAHTHASMSLLRGLADDLPLMTWLNEHIWPTEGRWVSEEFVRDGALLAIAEMLRGGVTCFNDMYFFPDVVARTAAECGMRACIGLIVIEFPSAWAQNADDYLSKAEVLHEQLQDQQLVSTILAPHAPYTVGVDSLRRIRALSEQWSLPVHIHLHETATEVTQFVEQHGCRPLARLNELGLLNERLLAVHMTQLEADEIARLASTGAKVLHCPESNLKLASGFCPIAALDAAGVSLALGTDGAASNNDLDMFGEMRSAALLAKAVAHDASALPAHRVLRMATLNAAHALGLGAQIGSLEVGKQADIIAVDLNKPETQPVYHPISQLVYACSRQQVSDVWIAGRRVLSEYALTTLDLSDVMNKAAHWQTRIAESDRPS